MRIDLRGIGAPLAVIAAVLHAGVAAADIDRVAKRAKHGDFDAVAQIGCAQEAGESFGICRAQVARSPDHAAVVVTFPNGFARVLTFEGGAFLRGNPTMSGVGTDVEWRLTEGAYLIRVDDQRFNVPEALVRGD